MVSYDFGCIENDTIGFTNGKYTKNGGGNPTGVVVKLYSASSRYPQSLSDYTEIGSATAELMGINLTGTALKGAQYLFYGAGEERIFIASYYAYGELASVQLTTNKNIISHADSEKATLTATIKDGDGEAIHMEDRLVTFYKPSIKSTQNSITITGEDTTTLENSTNNNGDKITFTVTNPPAAIALLFDETKTVSLRNLATNDKITTEHINGTYKVYVNNTLTESWSTDTNYSKIEIINSDSTSFTVNNYTHYTLTSLGTDYTDGLGTASYEYSSAGVGDVVFYAECAGILSSEIYVEDCKYYNKGDHIDDLLNPSNATMTTDGSAITISSSTSGQKNVYYPTGFFEADEDSSLEVEWITGATNAQRWASAIFNEADRDLIWFYLPAENKYTTYINSDYNTNVTCQTGDKIRMEKIGNTFSFYVNDVLLRQETHSTYKYRWGTYTNQNRSQTFKNIKIKPL